MVHEGAHDGGDSRDQVGQNLVNLKKLDNAISVAVENSEKCLEDALDTLTNGLVLMSPIEKKDKHSHARHRLSLADISVAIGI